MVHFLRKIRLKLVSFDTKFKAVHKILNKLGVFTMRFITYSRN